MRPAAALAALLPLALAACGRSAPARSVPDHVLLVVLDATHAGELTCHGGPEALTPNLDALAARGVRFDRAFSNTTWTLPSTTSLLTGLLQERHGVVTNNHAAGDELTLLPELFAAAGWRTSGFVQMVYASHRYGLGQGFEDYTYLAHQEGRDGDAPIAAATEWLRENEDGRTFTYLHLRRPHSPYDPRPKDAVEWVGPWPFDEWQPPLDAVHADVLGTRPVTDEQRAAARYLYRANLATVDRQIGALLSEWGRRDDALVVVTSDHGEGMGQHGFFGHGGALWAEVIDVPLIFAGAGLGPRVDHGVAATIDVAPTIAELCAVPWPASVPRDGVSLVPRLRGERDAHGERTVPISGRYHGNEAAPPETGAVRGRSKLVVGEDGSVRIFDRLGDRGELVPLAETDPELERAARELRELGLARARSGAVERELPADVEAELRALGYR